MTIDEFFAELEATGITFELQSSRLYDGHLRCKNGDCPILALGRVKGVLQAGFGNSDYVRVGAALGLARRCAHSPHETSWSGRCVWSQASRGCLAPAA